MISGEGRKNKLDSIKNERFYNIAKEQLSLAMIAWDQNYMIKDWNQEAEKLLGWMKEEVINKNLCNLCTVEETDGLLENKVEKIIKKRIHQIDQIKLQTKKTKKIITTWDNILIYNDNKEITEVVSLLHDITEKKNKDKKSKYLNFYDNLTGLYNREYFQEELKRLNVARQLPLSILVGDVNGLKLVNDAFGYLEGNQLIKNMANIFKEVCRKEDIIARVGGDEFAFIFPKTTKKSVEQIKQRIIKKCRNYSAQPIAPSIALGSASKIDIEEDINEVLALAEDRMYKHKLVESSSFRNCIISSLEKSMLEKSDETENHNFRLKQLALKLGAELDLDNEKLDELEILARLHDIGKIAIPDSILKKPGPLDEEEWSKMKEHPEIGYRIAEASKQLAAVADKILSHHEKWDGTGYPNGLKGKEIPLLARITTVVDAYDAMTNDRVYRAALEEKEAKEELINCAGTQFDPEIVDIFINQILEENVIVN